MLARGTLSTCPCCCQEAECKKEMLDVKFMADTKIADSKRAFELQKSAFSEEVNIKVRYHRASQVGGSGPGSRPLTAHPPAADGRGPAGL